MCSRPRGVIFWSPRCSTCGLDLLGHRRDLAVRQHEPRAVGAQREVEVAPEIVDALQHRRRAHARRRVERGAAVTAVLDVAQRERPVHGRQPLARRPHGGGVHPRVGLQLDTVVRDELVARRRRVAHRLVGREIQQARQHVRAARQCTGRLLDRAQRVGERLRGIGTAQGGVHGGAHVAHGGAAGGRELRRGEVPGLRRAGGGLRHREVSDAADEQRDCGRDGGASERRATRGAPVNGDLEGANIGGGGGDGATLG